jgi:uncharacterized protein
MREFYRVATGWLICALVTTSALAGSGDSNPAPFQDRHSKDVLRKMDDASTWGHPDQEGEFKGVLHFAKGDYVGAMKYFLDGARYADKLSQLCIGLMYLNGNGVRKDPVTAYAWLAIAAERKYPKFVATRDEVWSGLNAGQQQKAIALTEKLSLEYGDAVAKPRMVAQLMQDMLEGTQSHVGYDDGRIKAYVPQIGKPNGEDATTSCGTSSIAGAPISGCYNALAKNSLKPNDYFRSRDAEWEGTVTVGALQTVGDPPAPKASPDQQEQH